ncbi:YlzJ-like family protein [Alteribacter populi]|uniref:YlzJ-like family protein n=1 Tax=Alteribacter populi TaxID=2011011 RepID=UPI000BBB142A|nr:YlzJ-like family protein [Alteribacter populi]
MILYTYQSQDLIFPTKEEEFSKQQTVSIPGGSLVVEAVNSTGISGTKLRVIRLLTTDPNLYLEDQYQPGSLVDPQMITGGLD